LGAVRRTGDVEDARHPVPHRLVRHVKFPRDVPVGASLRDHLRNRLVNVIQFFTALVHLFVHVKERTHSANLRIAN
jgi:hypothetical protein